MKSYLLIAVLVIVSIFYAFTFAGNKIDLQASIKRGKEVYINSCITCHMENGEGVKAVFPPLAKSDYLLKDKERAIKQTLYGASGPMIVNGVTYNGMMLPTQLSDQETADVMNYVYNSWGNQGPTVTPEEVKKVREATETK